MPKTNSIDGVWANFEIPPLSASPFRTISNILSVVGNDLEQSYAQHYASIVFTKLSYFVKWRAIEFGIPANRCRRTALYVSKSLFRRVTVRPAFFDEDNMYVNFKALIDAVLTPLIPAVEVIEACHDSTIRSKPHLFLGLMKHILSYFETMQNPGGN
jgi:hypothetical protein